MGLALLRSSDRELRACDRSDTSLERLRSSSSRATMQITCNVRTLCSRVQTILRQRRRKQSRSLQISAPFNFQREPVLLPGISDDELAMLRDKAAASCIGIADPAIPRTPRSPSSTSSLFSHPMRPPIVTVHPPHATVSTETF